MVRVLYFEKDGWIWIVAFYTIITESAQCLGTQVGKLELLVVQSGS